MKRVGEVTDKERSFSLDVQNETSTEPVGLHTDSSAEEQLPVYTSSLNVGETIAQLFEQYSFSLI